MITKEIAAVFSLRVYDEGVPNQLNLPSMPYRGWTKLANPLPVTNGFAYGVFRNQGKGEVVISYRGTDGVIPGMLGFDGLNNAALSSASPSSQGRQAAQVYAEVLRLHGADAQGTNISFAGHSLGGVDFAGLAVYDDASSSTGKKLIITRASDADNIFNADFLVKTEKNLGRLVCTKASHYYNFRSCLRPYLLVKSPIGYLKTAERASLDVPVTCRRMRSCI